MIKRSQYDDYAYIVKRDTCPEIVSHPDRTNDFHYSQVYNFIIFQQMK